ncbi:MAG: hypothetical protein U5J64_02790 [Halobacteriales archaeon]|nr:hypothetical protein [Halobacteriales archaeon]
MPTGRKIPLDSPADGYLDLLRFELPCPIRSRCNLDVVGWTFLFAVGCFVSIAGFPVILVDGYVVVDETS